MSRNCERCGATPGTNSLDAHECCMHCGAVLCGECMEPSGGCGESLTGDHCPEPEDCLSPLAEAMADGDDAFHERDREDFR